MNPRICAVSTTVPDHCISQEDAIATYEAINTTLRPGIIAKIFRNALVNKRYFTLSAEEYPKLTGFPERNEIYLNHATRLAKQSIEKIFDSTEIDPQTLSLLVSSTVTGIAVPSLDARLINVLPFPKTIKRLPIFGLGCLAGVAGINRVADYLRAYPKEAAIFFTVELCSLTFDLDNSEMAHLVSSSLFGDGCAAVLMVGAEHALAKQAPYEVLAGQSYFFHDTQRVMGFDVAEKGLKVVLNANVPDIVTQNLPEVLQVFLNEQNLTKKDLDFFVTHPGGPKVLQALQSVLEVSQDKLSHSWDCLREFGNMSSASVLFTLERTMHDDQPKNALGLMSAMGPAFCSELSLIRRVS